MKCDSTGPPPALIGAAMRVFLDANILFCAAKSDGAVFGRTVGGVAIHSPRSLAEAALAAGR